MPETLGIVPKRDVLLQMPRFGLADSKRNYWLATVEPHVTREDIMTPSHWANMAHMIKQFDRIEVRQDDGKFFSEYLVLRADKNSVYLKELTWYDLSKKLEAANPDFVYKYRGPHAKHSIIRAVDSSVLVEHLETKAEAEKWLVEYLDKI